MDRMQILLVVGFMFVGCGLALECYLCDTEDFGKKCGESDPDTDKLDRYISEDKDTCFACSKSTYDDGDKQTTRGCLSKSSYKDYGVKTDQCKKVTIGSDDDAELCVCDSDKCNGSQHLAVSMATVFFAATAKLLF